MAPNLVSHWRHSSRGTKSFYEELRGGGNDDYKPGAENRGVAGSDDMDENNWAQDFRDEDLDHVARIGAEDSQITASSAGNLAGRNPGSLKRQQLGSSRMGPTSKWMSPEDDGDNDVPASLLVEHQDAPLSTRAFPRRKQHTGQKQATLSGPSSHKSQAQWERARAQQRLHDTPPNQGKPAAPIATGAIVAGDASEKALWRWINVSNLDYFMKDVYEYFLGSGFWCIICERILHLVQSSFFAIFLTFLTQCIDYSKVPESRALSEVIIGQCTKEMSWYWNLGLWLFIFYFIWKAVQFVVDMRRLLLIQEFYVHLLGIPEQDMQTVSWQDIVGRIMALRDSNPSTALNLTPAQRKWIQAHSKERLDAVDIASRLMRKDNYLIALINKDILSLSLPLPFVKQGQYFSGTLQWWLYFCIIDFVFDHRGQVNQEFLKSSSRGLLSRKLRERLRVAGFLNLLCTPFWVGYQVIIHLLNYYNEFKKDSATLSDRRYTALARWKFREFNELPHFFQERVNMSYPFASRYMDQFPKRLVEQVAKAVTFISGAIIFVLAGASFLDPELFLGFEITKEKTALFYFGVFGSIWALARGLILEETTVFDPEFALRGVTDFTHYIPDHWQGRLHSFDVKREFSELYKLKVVILVEEIVGIFLASLVLIFSIPKSSDQIIDFFREFTIHVDGLGYVCSFAEFNFKQGTINGTQQPGSVDVREDYYAAKHGKMAASYYGFLENYVVNPKTGIPGGNGPSSLRHRFQPPPAFPGLNSPTFAAEMPVSRAGRADTARARSGQSQVARTPRYGPPMTGPSPMASVLLDPHHQPSGVAFGGRGRNLRGDTHLEQSIIEEATEDGAGARIRSRDQEDEDDDDAVYESGGQLGGSVWQTSPAKTIYRESSQTTGLGQDTGVLGLIYQFQQAHRDNRMGGTQ